MRGSTGQKTTSPDSPVRRSRQRWMRTPHAHRRGAVQGSVRRDVRRVPPSTTATERGEESIGANTLVGEPEQVTHPQPRQKFMRRPAYVCTLQWNLPASPVGLMGRLVEARTAGFRLYRECDECGKRVHRKGNDFATTHQSDKVVSAECGCRMTIPEEDLF